MCWRRLRSYIWTILRICWCLPWDHYRLHSGAYYRIHWGTDSVVDFDLDPSSTCIHWICILGFKSSLWYSLSLPGLTGVPHIWLLKALSCFYMATSISCWLSAMTLVDALVPDMFPFAIYNSYDVGYELAARRPIWRCRNVSKLGHDGGAWIIR